MCAVAFAGAPSTAGATYSVVAADAKLRTVGGAGASCVGALDVSLILGVAPGRGAVHAQALVNLDARDEAVALLGQGLDPKTVLSLITAPAFDPDAAERQYGVVTLGGRAAAFTGATNGVFSGHRWGRVGAFSYAVQGNILTGEAVLAGAEAGFVEGGGCDLPDRLMLALEAGAAGGSGDLRCASRGVPADSAFVRVVDADGGVVVDLSVTDTRTEDPLAALRRSYDAWRSRHPCVTSVSKAPATDRAVPPPPATRGFSRCTLATEPPWGAWMLVMAIRGRRRRSSEGR